MRLAAAVILCTVTVSSFAQQTQSSFQFNGFVSLRGIYVKAPRPWTEGAFGRFDVGALSPDDNRLVNLQSAQLGFDWTPARWLLVHADGIARREPSPVIGDSVGLVQAFADVFSEHLRLRAGVFWLPTSRENIDPLWNSRYTITYSALNTWIGNEVRPLSADLQYSTFYFTAGATAFRGNDTMGTVLADRGWAFGNRLTTYREIIAVPPPDRTTHPIGNDLDGRFGFAGRIRAVIPERAMLQIMHLDNRAELVPGVAPNIPWATKFNLISFDAGAQTPSTVAAEWIRGKTTVAFPGGTFSLDFGTYYILGSTKRGRDRYTLRVERFWTRSHARVPDDASREDGKAFTIAWLRDLGEHVRGGLEYVRVDGDRPGLAVTTYDPRTGGSTITLEVRLNF